MGDPNFVSQSTLQSKKSIYPFVPNIPENRDVRITITPIALNMQKGADESIVVRLDPSSGLLFLYKRKALHERLFIE